MLPALPRGGKTQKCIDFVLLGVTKPDGNILHQSLPIISLQFRYWSEIWYLFIGFAIRKRFYILLSFCHHFQPCFPLNLVSLVLLVTQAHLQLLSKHFKTFYVFYSLIYLSWVKVDTKRALCWSKKSTKPETNIAFYNHYT